MILPDGHDHSRNQLHFPVRFHHEKPFLRLNWQQAPRSMEFSIVTLLGSPKTLFLAQTDFFEPEIVSLRFFQRKAIRYRLRYFSSTINWKSPTTYFSRLLTAGDIHFLIIAVLPPLSEHQVNALLHPEANLNSTRIISLGIICSTIYSQV